MGHVISFLGFALRLNWAWLFRVRKKAEDGRAVGLWPGFNDFSVFRVQHYSARHIGNRAYCYSILRQNVTYAKHTLSCSSRVTLLRSSFRPSHESCISSAMHQRA